MTSAPNLRPLLNGNRTWFILFLIGICTSCQLFKVAEDETQEPQSDELDTMHGRRVWDPVRGEYVYVREMPTEKMDTVNWIEVPDNQSNPIVSTGVAGQIPAAPSQPIRTEEYGSQILNEYNVALLLPFLTNYFDPATRSINQNSSWALNFYAGSRIALDELQSEGVRLQVSVLDSKASPSEINQLLTRSQNLQRAHLIIGPYRREGVQLVADFAKRNNITFVSPYSAADNLTNRNENYIQVSSTLGTHCTSIANHALARYRPEQIILVSSNDPAEQARLKYFQQAHFTRSGSRNANKLEEFIVASNTSSFNDLDVMPFVQLQDTTVFIIPSWHETFVYNFLRKLDVAKGEDREIVVYGMPQWTTFEHIDLDYYEKLNVHVSSNYYIDSEAPTIQFFRREYFNRFGKIAPLEAYLGYDVMLYFGRMLKKYGTKFQYQLDQNPAQYLHTKFDFQAVVVPTTTGAENLPIEKFENKYVNILNFQDYEFQLAN